MGTKPSVVEATSGEEQLSPPPDARGEQVELVPIQIDYAIVEHFSSHLYSSPSKAVEELVANGYDAFAAKVFVYIPGRFTPDRVIVWDDGESMDLAELHHLWWIARSPKEGDRIARRSGRPDRAQIGKFGIGKLASSAVGYRITHLCKKNSQFLRISVDYRRVPRIEGKETRKPYQSWVVRLTEPEARDYVSELFTEDPAAVAELWNTETWTIAIVDDLKPDVQLKEGRLRWILGNGMPYRPDFRVTVNDVDVTPRLSEGAHLEWNLRTQEVRDQLRLTWNEAVERAEVSGEIVFEEDGAPTAIFPALRHVRVEVRLFLESLRKKASEDAPRSYGFFIMVRDRLLNEDDPEVFLAPPSFGTFYRTQFIIWADGLDDALLADRESVQRASPQASELAVLQQALYLAARNALETLDEQDELQNTSEALLPVESLEHFRQPLTALLVRMNETSSVDLGSLRIERAAVNPDAPLAVFDEATGRFRVNLAHPLIAALHERITGRKAPEALRGIDLFAVSERLLEGFLFDLGLNDDVIDQTLTWRDELFRMMAQRYAVDRGEVVERVYEASYAGDKPFEVALADLFRLMGFNARRYGASGEKDVLVVAPIGVEHFSFTLEAKGSKGPVENDTADVADAAAHATDAGADFAVIIAREFTGFKKSRDEAAQILKACKEQKRPTYFATVETVVALYQAMKTFGYPLDVVRNVLGVHEAPQEKLARAREFLQPTKDLDVRAVLEAIWEQQGSSAEREEVSYYALRQSSPEWKVYTIDDFTMRLVAIQTLARGLVRVRTSQYLVHLLQRPDIVAEQVARSLDEQKGP